mmetsp:Transcript_38104/g.93431  ORF Transcript_38104/g.93431 Transcript_38104/m.93431 type:complete len:92 (+) Transcript_38104:380-655(+)
MSLPGIPNIFTATSVPNQVARFSPTTGLLSKAKSSKSMQKHCSTRMPASKEVDRRTTLRRVREDEDEETLAGAEQEDFAEHVDMVASSVAT